MTFGRHSNLTRHDVCEGLPLLDRRQVPPVRPAVADGAQGRVDWARTLLLRSGLDIITSEQLRTLVAQVRPRALGNGLWLGRVFQSPWFERAGYRPSTRPDARGRMIGVYRLTSAGVTERARLNQSVTKGRA